MVLAVLSLLDQGSVHRLAVWAYAVTFTAGNNPQADEQKVLYSALQTSMGITGLTNQTNTSVLLRLLKHCRPRP